MNTPSTRSPVELDLLLDALFKPGDGLVELRALPSKARIFVEPGDTEKILQFIERNQDQDIYFGVAARKDASSGRMNNCSTVRAIYVDIDFKDFDSPDEARNQLDNFSLTPSFLVHSGGGLHVYWLLDTPLNVQHDAAKCRNLLRRTARAVGGDIAAAEPARVLRLPGTLNHKYDPPREVHLV